MLPLRNVKKIEEQGCRYLCFCFFIVLNSQLTGIEQKRMVLIIMMLQHINAVCFSPRIPKFIFIWAICQKEWETHAMS